MMIKIAKLTEADRGRIIAWRVTPHIKYEGALGAWSPTHLYVAFPKHVRHGNIKARFVIELVNPNDANFKDEHDRNLNRKRR